MSKQVLLDFLNSEMTRYDTVIYNRTKEIDSLNDALDDANAIIIDAQNDQQLLNVLIQIVENQPEK